jgi:glycerophosphoryl diester phosphodiesterase
MPESYRPLLLGHRGARAVRAIPENTLESFDRALADGCDGFEFDVRLSADGVAVVCHGRRYHGLGVRGASAGRLGNLPQLEQVLSRYQHRAFLDVELKVSGLEKITLELLRRYPPQRGFVVSSFLPRVLLALRKESRSVPLGLICQTRGELLRWRKLAVEFVIPHQMLARAFLLRELKREGKRILVWTVNKPAYMLRFRDLKVDGIISDETALLCRAIGTEAEAPWTDSSL